ncbi:MAG TPA: bifunctional acetate--CoA ligase family protein/GNAT family N-acetyltransferase [Stellaceae bacterium]
MSVRNLDKMFKPASVALIGATPRQGSVGAVLLRNLRRAGFKGPLLLVNPHHKALDGMPVFPDVASLPAAPDLAVIATPPETVPGLVAALGARGTRAVIVITAGFGELGERGRALQQATLDAARPHLLRLIGPNCVGIMVPGIGLDATFSHIAPKAGDLAFVSQSGAMITAVLDWVAPRNIGFSHVVSLGDMADVDFGDMLDYLASDGATRAILLYIEAIKEARKFMSAARAAARTKPVLVVKAGRFAEGARAAASHTGALAGADAVYEAAFRRAGMLRVHDMAELFDAVETLALTQPQYGDRLAILTNGGGPGVLATDDLIGMGGALAALSPETVKRLDAVLPRTWSRGNPVDIIGDADGRRYADALSILLEDENTDAVLVLDSPTALGDPAEAARAVIDTVAEVRRRVGLHGRNVITAWLGEQTAAPARRLFEDAHIATYETPGGAVRGFMHRIQYRRHQELLMETPAMRPDSFEPDSAAVGAVIAHALAAGRQWLEADEVAAVLKAYGVPFAAPRLVGDPDAAAQAAAEMGFPVVLKIRSPDLPHKSDVGGVALNLGSVDRVRDVATSMLAHVRSTRPEARLEGFLVQPMIHRPTALELIVGLSDDPIFGPVVMFGQGGVAVELTQDTALELPPLNQALARAQMARTRIWRLLKGFRGQPPVDIGAVAEALIRIGQLAADHAEIAELDINPLLANASGMIGVDARIRVAVAARRGAARLSISPDPKEFVGTGTLRDGTPVRLRPIRPEDEPLLRDMASHMSLEDLRLRFFSPIRELTHQAAARLSQIDYAREMALIAEPGDTSAALGVARYSADPDNRCAEFAIAVRSDWKRRGLGRLLMLSLLDVARRRGVETLAGDVLRENDAMLRLCRALDFSLAMHPADPAVVRVTRPTGARAAGA